MPQSKDLFVSFLILFILQSTEMWTLIVTIYNSLSSWINIPQTNNFSIIGGLITRIPLGYVLLIHLRNKRFSQINSHSTLYVHHKLKPYKHALRIIFFVLLMFTY